MTRPSAVSTVHTFRLPNAHMDALKRLPAEQSASALVRELLRWYIDGQPLSRELLDLRRKLFFPKPIPQDEEAA